MTKYTDHDSLMLLTEYLRSRMGTVDEIVYAVEKPWKYGTEIDLLRFLTGMGYEWEDAARMVDEARDEAQAIRDSEAVGPTT